MMTVKIYERGTVIEEDTCTITFKNGQTLEISYGKVCWDEENEKIIIHDQMLPYLIVSKTDGVCMRAESTSPYEWNTVLDERCERRHPRLISYKEK